MSVLSLCVTAPFFVFSFFGFALSFAVSAVCVFASLLSVVEPAAGISFARVSAVDEMSVFSLCVTAPFFDFSFFCFAFSFAEIFFSASAASAFALSSAAFLFPFFGFAAFALSSVERYALTAAERSGMPPSVVCSMSAISLCVKYDATVLRTSLSLFFSAYDAA